MTAPAAPPMQKQKRSVTALLMTLAAAGSLLLAATRNGNEQRGPAFLRSDAIDEPSSPHQSRRQLRYYWYKREKKGGGTEWYRTKKKKKKTTLADPKTVVARGPPLLTTRADCWYFLASHDIEVPRAPTPYEQWEELAWGTCTGEERDMWIASDCVGQLRAYEPKEDGLGIWLPRPGATAASPEEPRPAEPSPIVS